MSLVDSAFSNCNFLRVQHRSIDNSPLSSKFVTFSAGSTLDRKRCIQSIFIDPRIPLIGKSDLKPGHFVFSNKFAETFAKGHQRPEMTSPIDSAIPVFWPRSNEVFRFVYHFDAVNLTKFAHNGGHAFPVFDDITSWT
jgi:hypothetical protein